MYAQLPYREYEQLVQVLEKMRNSRKRSFARKARNINPVCLIQNDLRKKLSQVKPNKMQPIEDNYTGVDYLYNSVKIDQKFSFGDSGDNAIIVRTKNRRLLNNSDWTMIINKEEQIELFETRKLAEFVKRNWGIVQKNFIEKAIGYEKYKIQLDDFYKNEKLTPITTELETIHLTLTLNRISKQSEEIKNTLNLFPLICEVQQ